MIVLIPKSLQQDGVDLSNLDFLSHRIPSLKYLRSTTLDFTDIGISKSEFVTKTQFLYKDYLFP